MKWLRVLVLLVLAALAAALTVAIAARRPLEERVTTALHGLIEREVGAALHTPLTLEGLEISWAPLGVDARGVVLGADGAVGRVAAVSARLLPRTSLRQGRPVVDVTLRSPILDLPALVRMIDGLASDDLDPTPAPRMRIRLRAQQPDMLLAHGERPIRLRVDALAGSITTDGLDGRLRFAASAEGGRIAFGDDGLDLVRIAARGGETETGFHLYDADVVADGVELHGRPDGARLRISGRATLPKLAFLDASLASLAGEARLEAMLIGALEEPTVQGTVRADPLSVDGRELGAVQVDATLRREDLAVTAAVLKGFGGEVQGDGTLTFDAPLSYRARVRWQGLDIRQLVDVAPQVIKPAQAAGESEVSGTAEPLAVNATGHGAFAPLGGGTPLEWRGSGAYADGLGRIELDAGQGGRNTLRGHAEVGPRDALRGRVETTVADPPALGAFLPIENAPNVSGSLSMAADVSGSTAAPRLAGELNGRGIAVFGVNIERVGGSVGLDQHALRATAVRATLWQGGFLLDGTLALDQAGANDVRLQIDNLPGGDLVALIDGATGTLLPIGRGTLNARLVAGGPWSRAQVTGEATMTGFWLSRQWIEEARLHGTAAWPRWQLDGGLRNQADETLTLRASGSGLEHLSVAAHSEAWQLTSLQRGDLTEMGGSLGLDARFEGPPSALNGQAMLTATGLAVSGRQFGGLEVAVSAQRGRWQAETDLLDGAVVVGATLSPQAGWPLTLTARWTDANFAPLLTPAADTSIVSSGAVQLRAPVADLAQLDGSARIDLLRLANGPFAIAAVGAPEIVCRRGTCRIQRLILQGMDTELTLGGTATVGGGLDVTVDGHGDLRLLEVLVEPIESARGRFTLAAEIRRGGGGGAVTGDLRLDQAALDVGAPVGITRTTGRLVFDGDTIRIVELSGRMDTGTFTVGGAIDLQRGPDLTWRFTDVGVVPLPSLEAEASGEGTFSGTWERLRLAGDITVSRMLYDRDFELTDLLPSFNRALAAAPRPPSPRQLELDLHVVAPGELYVENNIARIEASADMRLTGTVERPVLSGRVEVLDGQFDLRRRTFDIESAIADFRPDLGTAAALNISASSSIDTRDATYDVFIRVTGTTRDPRVALGSDDPGLSQTDVATLIAFGQTQSQMRETAGAFGVYDLLGMVPTGGVEQTATRVLPIDRISVESVYSRNSGTFQPQLKIGRDLTDNLALSLGQTFGVESRTLVEADYRLSPRVFVLLSWESQTETEEGAFGGGVRLRYEFWRVTPYTLLGLGALR